MLVELSAEVIAEPGLDAPSLPPTVAESPVALVRDVDPTLLRLCAPRLEGDMFRGLCEIYNPPPVLEAGVGFAGPIATFYGGGTSAETAREILELADNFDRSANETLVNISLVDYHSGEDVGTGALELGTGGPLEIPTAQHCATLRVDGLPQTRCRRVGDFDAPLLVITREGRYRLRLSTEGLRSVVSEARVHVVGNRATVSLHFGALTTGFHAYLAPLTTPLEVVQRDQYDNRKLAPPPPPALPPCEPF